MIFSSDIDGIFNNYPESFIYFLYLKTGVRFHSIRDAKQNLGLQYSYFKDEYRHSGYKYEIPYEQDTLRFYKCLMSRDIKIVFSTSRPFDKYPEMFQKTEEWLKESGVEYLALVEKSKENLIKFEVDYHLDDELEHIEKLLDSNNKCDFFILNRGAPKSYVISNKITSINSPQLILNFLDKK